MTWPVSKELAHFSLGWSFAIAANLDMILLNGITTTNSTYFAWSGTSCVASFVNDSHNPTAFEFQLSHATQNGSMTGFEGSLTYVSSVGHQWPVGLAMFVASNIYDVYWSIASLNIYIIIMLLLPHLIFSN